MPDGAEAVPLPGVAPQHPVLDQRADLQPVLAVARHGSPWSRLLSVRVLPVIADMELCRHRGEKHGSIGKHPTCTEKPPSSPAAPRASAGIIRMALAAQGARVMIADIADGKAVAAEIVAQHGADSAVSFTFDVADEASVKALVAETVKRFGQIDILVNNAAVYSTLKPRNFDEWDIETWDKVMAVNVRGPYLMVRHVAPHMKTRGSGKIINIASGTPIRACRACCLMSRPRAPCWLSPVRCRANWAPSASPSIRCRRALSCPTPGSTIPTHVEEERIPVRNSRAFKRDGYPEDLLGALVFLAPATAISSPASRWWWTAARSITSYPAGAGQPIPGVVPLARELGYKVTKSANSSQGAGSWRLQPRLNRPPPVPSTMCRARGRPITTRSPSSTWRRCGKCSKAW